MKFSVALYNNMLPDLHLFEEGVHFNVSEKLYRDAEGVSQSLLKEFGNAATPKHFLAREPRVATPDMEFGTVCHAAVLTPDKFVESYWLQPSGYAAVVKGESVMKPWHGGATECKAWLATHADRPVMTKDQLEKVSAIKARLELIEQNGEYCPLVFASALRHGKTEVAFFKRDEETGLMLKCRVDLISDAQDGTTWLFDMKKVQSGEATHEAFGKSCVNYGYDIQAAAYLEITGASKFVFVPFDDDRPFDACCYEPDYEMLNIGRAKWRSLLNRYAACAKSNDWPGYPVGLQRLSLPQWATKL